MAATAATDDVALAVEEAHLARDAAGGDGEAFATLYARYEQRAYNLAYRILGSEHDAADATQEAFLSVMRRLPKLDHRELAFGSYLFTATRNASYDLMERQRRAGPSDSIPESAVPVGSGGGAAMPDPGDPEEDPDRKLLLESQQEEIRAANMRLPERQREALALRELEELSYDEIAAIMEMNRNSVAQLISRARVNLRDELRGTALAALAASSPDCERALPLIAMRDDGQLDSGSGDGAWLDSHLAGCERCRLGVEAMQEAGASYRAWAPIAAAPWLFRETMARAAELAGADWSDVARPGAGRTRWARRNIALAAGLAALLLGGVLAAALDDSPPSQPATDVSRRSSEPARPAAKGQGKKTKSKARPAAQPAPTDTGDAAPLPSTSTSQAPASDAQKARSAPAKSPGGTAGLGATKTTSTPKQEAEAEPSPEELPPPTEPPPTTEPQPEEPRPEEPRPEKPRPEKPPTREAPIGVAPSRP